MLSFHDRWTPVLDWNTQPGIALKKLISALPQDKSWELVVFGSCPLALGLSPSFISADVDVYGNLSLEKYIKSVGLHKDQHPPVYIEENDSLVFRTCSDWTLRASRHKEGSVEIIFPHPIDILVSKVRRLEEKDLMAFKKVRELTGGPGEEELKLFLQKAVDIYRPSFDEENSGGDAIENTKVLWRELFNKVIDPRKEIIIPAIERKNESEGVNLPDYKKILDDRIRD